MDISPVEKAIIEEVYRSPVKDKNRNLVDDFINAFVRVEESFLDALTAGGDTIEGYLEWFHGQSEESKDDIGYRILRFASRFITSDPTSKATGAAMAFTSIGRLLIEAQRRYDEAIKKDMETLEPVGRG